MKISFTFELGEARLCLLSIGLGVILTLLIQHLFS